MNAFVPLTSTPTRLQLHGFRPPGLPAQVRETMQWEVLRKAIYNCAMRFGDKLTFDFRELLTDAGNARAAGQMMWRLIKRFEPDVLVGPGFGATPLLYATALAALDDGISLQVLMVRDKRKEHNQKRWVEGNRAAAQGKRAVFIDDFMKRGTAYPLVQQALKADKVQVELAAIALFFDMWEPLGTRQLSLSTVPLVALYTRHDLGLSRDCYDAVPPEMKGAAPDFVGSTPRWWRFDLNQSLKHPLKCAPLIAKGAVYVADEKATLWKHRLDTGDIEWSVPSLEIPEKGIVQQLQQVDGSLLYGCYDGTLSRVACETGAVQWRRKLDAWIHATPAIDQASGRIFINTEQMAGGRPCGHVQCLELATGKLVWKHRQAWWPPASVALCERTNTVLAACNDETLLGLDAATGELKWTANTRGLIRGRPYARDGRAWLATERGHLHCIDVRTGGQLWSTRYGAGLWHQFTMGENGEIYAMDGEWHFTAFDADTGAMRWLGRLRSVGCWAPVPCGRYLVVLSRQGNLAVFCPQEQIKIWEGQIPGTYHQPPAIHDGVLVAASSTAGLLAFDIHPFYAN